MDTKYSTRGLILVAIALVAVSAMVALPAAAQSDDRFEPNDHTGEAAEIEPGTYEDLRMADDEWADYYAVELEEGENLSSSIAFDHDEANLGMALIGPNSRYEDFSFSRTDGESVDVTADEAGTYYVAVWNFDTTGADYDLTVETDGAEPEGDRFENNDELEAAAPIESGEHENLTVSNGDRDFYAVQADAGDQIVASSQIYSADADLTVWVHGPDDERFASSGETEWRPAGTVAEEAGTYYVVVTSNDNESVRYDLQVGVGQGDQFDPNEDDDQISTIEPGTYSDLQLTSGPDVDSYDVELQQGDELRVSTAVSGDSSAEIFLTDEDGEHLENSSSSPYSDDHGLSYTADERGTYTVNVRSEDGSATAYDLEIEVDDAARTYGDGIYENETVSAGDSNTYELESVDGGDQLAVATRAANASDDLNLDVYGPTFILASDGEDGNWQNLGHVPDQETTYQVEVSTDSDEPVTYDLLVDDGAADRFDPNEGDSEAASVEPGTYEDLSLVGPADTDVYTLELTKGEEVSIQTEPSAGQAVDLWVGGPNDEQSLVSDSHPYGDDESISFTAESNGTYTIQAYNQAGSDHEGSTYDLEIEVEEPEPTYGDGHYENQTVTADSTQTYQLEAVDAGETLAVATQLENANDDLQVRLLGPTEFHTVEDTGEWRSIELVPDESKTFTVEVSTESSDPVSYDLHVNTGSADRFDPNGEVSQAAEIEAGTYGNLSLAGPADTDTYQLDLTRGQRVGISTKHTAGKPVDLYVIGPNHDQTELSTQAPYADEEHAVFTARSNGTYTVRAYNADVGDHDGSTYELDVSDLGYEEPEPIYEGGTYDNQTVTNDSPNTYQLGSVGTEKLVAAAARLEDSDSDLSVRVIGPDVITQDSEGTYWRATEIATESPGAYEVEVSTDDTEPVSYDLYLSTGEADEREPNLWNDQVQIDPGTYENRTIAGIADQDAYAVDLEEGEQIQVDVTSSDLRNTTVYAQKYDGSHLEVAERDGDSKTLTLVANSNGTYGLSVTASENRSIEYDLEIDVTDS